MPSAPSPDKTGVPEARKVTDLLLPRGSGPKSLPREQQKIPAETRLRVAREDMQIVGVPADTKDNQRCYVRWFTRGEPKILVREPVRFEDAQATFQISRVSAASRITFLLGTYSPAELWDKRPSNTIR